MTGDHESSIVHPARSLSIHLINPLLSVMHARQGVKAATDEEKVDRRRASLRAASQRFYERHKHARQQQGAELRKATQQESRAAMIFTPITPVSPAKAQALAEAKREAARNRRVALAKQKADQELADTLAARDHVHMVSSTLPTEIPLSPRTCAKLKANHERHYSKLVREHVDELVCDSDSNLPKTVTVGRAKTTVVPGMGIKAGVVERLRAEVAGLQGSLHLKASTGSGVSLTTTTSSTTTHLDTTHHRSSSILIDPSSILIDR